MIRMRTQKRLLIYFLLLGLVGSGFLWIYSESSSSMLSFPEDNWKTVKKASEGSSVPIPKYTIGDYWNYNMSQCHYKVSSGNNELITTIYGRSNYTIIAIESILDRDGEDRMCYVERSLLYVFPTEIEGSIYTGYQENYAYYDIQNLNLIKSSSYYEESIDSEFEMLMVTNTSCSINSSTDFYPLESNKIVSIIRTINSTLFRKTRSGNNSQVSEYEEMMNYTMTPFSDFSTSLGVFEGIKVEVVYDLDFDYFIPHYEYYFTQNIGRFIFENINYTYFEGEMPTESIIIKYELTNYYYAYAGTSSIGSSFGTLLGVSIISIAMLYELILQKKNRAMRAS